MKIEQNSTVAFDLERTSLPYSDTNLSMDDIDHVVIDVTSSPLLKLYINDSLKRAQKMFPSELESEEIVMNSSEIVMKMLERIVDRFEFSHNEFENFLDEL